MRCCLSYSTQLVRRRTTEVEREGAGAGALEAGRISAISPAAARRVISICHRRSCAPTYPRAKNRASRLGGGGGGNPRASRTTETGGWRPATVEAPARWGRGAGVAPENPGERTR